MEGREGFYNLFCHFLIDVGGFVGTLLLIVCIIVWFALLLYRFYQLAKGLDDDNVTCPWGDNIG